MNSNNRTLTFNVLVYEKDLYGDMKKSMSRLKKHGEYFYIKHNKNDVLPHYHIYFLANYFMHTSEVRELFKLAVAKHEIVGEYKGTRKTFVEYMLLHGEYKRHNIVTTMSLK